MNNTIFLKCRIDGEAYTACGNSTSKKDAQMNAAKDMTQFLVRTNKMNSNDIPPSTLQVRSTLSKRYFFSD